MSKIDLDKVPVKTGSIYPAPFDSQMAGRSSLRLGEAGGLTQFGVNIVILQPGARSSLRHWHLNEDEFVMITQGSCTLIDNDGATQMHPGDCVAFPAGVENAHHFINQTDAEARFLVVGSRKNPEHATYPDNDLKVAVQDGKATFTHHDGRAYQEPQKGE